MLNATWLALDDKNISMVVTMLVIINDNQYLSLFTFALAIPEPLASFFT